MVTAQQRAVFDALGGALSDDREEKTLSCRILMRLCVIDGELHPNEQMVLEATMIRHGLDAGARGRIAAEMAVLLHNPGATSDPDATAAAATPVLGLISRLSAAALTELLVHLEHGAWADGRIVPAEAWLLNTVRCHLAARRA